MVSSNNAIYNTVGASISGVTNTLTVTNGSNTASSAARETIVVGGGSAGDPTINWNVSGVTNWEMGIDNSVSDNLTISQGTALGTNDVWRMNTSGQRIMPLQPAFEAFLSASVGNVTGDNTNYTLICDTEKFDQSSNYNNATGVFTAPVTGIYLLSGTVAISNLAAAHNYLTIQIGYSTLFITTYFNPYPIRNPSNNCCFNVSGVVKMSSGDQATLQVRLAGGTKTAGVIGNVDGSQCSFSGCLLC